jgi:hypothetical protein
LDRRDLLQACLQSLAGQSVGGFEVILVDNGSQDGSTEMAKKDFEGNANFSLHIIENDSNKGFCEANNQGIAASRGEFIALLNNDAEAEPGWLAALVRGITLRDDIGMAASKILVWENPGKIDKAGHLIYLDGQNRGRGSGELDVGQYDQIEEVLWPDGCAAMYRREMIDQIGGFDEDFFAYADDAELGLRARIAGWGCIYMPDAVVRHHRGATLGVLSSRRMELIERNRILLAVKLFPARLLFLNGFYFSLRIGAGLIAALRGRGEVSRFPGFRGKLRIAKALLKANLDAFRMLPSTLRKRRAFHPLRQLNARQTVRLLKHYRISLKTLMEQAI